MSTTIGKPVRILFRGAVAGVSFAAAAILFLSFLTPGCGKKEEQQLKSSIYTGQVETDSATGQPVIVLARGGDHPLTAKIAPKDGANLYSLNYEGKELLYGPLSLDSLPGYRYGTPVLYPAPNRVAGGKFTYGGRTFNFGINEKDRFLHALVHSVPWQYDAPTAGPESAQVEMYLDFTPGSALYEKFPFNHRFSLKFTLDSLGIRFDYSVINRDSLTLPYGFAIHPYFTFLGNRDQVSLCVPAQWHMQAVDLMPTGKLDSLAGSPYDLRKPTPVDSLVLDEVYYGMRPESPAFLEYSQTGLKVVLDASAEFTHMVVYAQPQNPFVCVENQTCSTDAHNLYARGLVDESHLLFATPGGTSSGWIHFLIGPQN
jgi:aldose 1-epimerase